MLKSLDRAFEKFRYQSRLKWGSFQWNRIGGGRTEPRNGKKSGRKMETICSTSVNPSGRLNMTSLNCFSYYVYISNILSFYYIIKLGSPTLFPTIFKISIENFGHRRENQECLSLLAQSCVIHDRLVPISKGINFQRYDAIVDDISAIRPELKTLLGEGGGREGRDVSQRGHSVLS